MKVNQKGFQQFYINGQILHPIRREFAVFSMIFLVTTPKIKNEINKNNHFTEKIKTNTIFNKLLYCAACERIIIMLTKRLEIVKTYYKFKCAKAKKQQQQQQNSNNK